MPQLHSLLLLASVSIALPACDRVDPCSVGEPADPAVAERIAIVTPQEVDALRKANAQAVVIDVNPKEIYDEGHVPGARWMRFDQADRSVLPTDRATPIVLYCFNPVCGASHQAASAVASAGWKDVRRMSAGIQGWKAAGLPVELAR